MKTLKFTRDVLVAGQHCATGSTREVPAPIAIDLIRAGDAIEVDPAEAKPEKSAPEKADSKAKKETAARG